MWGKAAGMARAGRHRLPRSPDRTEGGERPKAADCSHSRRNPDESRGRSEEHTSELQSLMRLSYAVFRLKKKTTKTIYTTTQHMKKQQNLAQIHNIVEKYDKRLNKSQNNTNHLPTCHEAKPSCQKNYCHTTTK